MSLNGNLEHFPIIDIIQLLHGSKKSGILRLTSDKGESQLVFHEGDLVSANFLNNRVRIGQVLVSAGAISEEQLLNALEIQKNAGNDRKPLVITLLEREMVDETAAYNGIESLIEMTVVEVLTWKEGQFSLEVASGENAGSYHFSRTNFPQRILLNAQGILMDSLRIYDEKIRDGSMDEILSIAGVSNLDLNAEQPGHSAQSIQPSSSYGADNVPSALQQLLAEQRSMIQRSSDQSYREVDTVKKLIVELFPSDTKEKKRQLLAFLAAPIPEGIGAAVPPDIAVIVITSSPLLSTIVRSICYQNGVYAVTTDNVASLDINIRLLLCQTLHLVIFLDVPHDETTQDTIQICKDLRRYPQASVVLAACSRFWDSKGIQALSSGIRNIIPRPCSECSGGSSIEHSLSFCSSFGQFLQTLSTQYSNTNDQRFFACISKLRSCTSRSEIAVAVLEYLIAIFERAIVFQVTDTGLVAEHSFGVKGQKGDGISLLPSVTVPLDDQEVFEQVLKSGLMYYGFHSDSTWPHELYRITGRPDSPEVLVIPFIRANSVVALIYADFAKELASSPSLYYLDALVQYTTAQMSVSAYRQKIKVLMDEAEQKKVG
jgi:hypothetical protein